MRLVLTKSTITQVVDELRNINALDQFAGEAFNDWFAAEFAPLEPGEQFELVDRFMSISQNAASVARVLLDRMNP